MQHLVWTGAESTCVGLTFEADVLHLSDIDSVFCLCIRSIGEAELSRISCIAETYFFAFLEQMCLVSKQPCLKLAGVWHTSLTVWSPLNSNLVLSQHSLRNQPFFFIVWVLMHFKVLECVSIFAEIFACFRHNRVWNIRGLCFILFYLFIYFLYIFRHVENEVPCSARGSRRGEG